MWEADHVRIGNYERGERLDTSSLYDDFTARHATLGHVVLLRHEKWASSCSAEQVGALRRARRFQAEIRHPNILALVDFFEADRETYSIFPLYPDLHRLASILSDAARWAKIDVYLRICGGLTGALSAIHRRGYIHRTISMRSILVEPEGEPYFADLGCAMDLRTVESGGDDPIAAAAREFMAPARAAPEQLEGEQALSPGTDIWALGTILYEVRYQRHPFAGRGTGLPEMLFNIQSMELGFPSVPAESARAEEERLLRPWFVRLLDKNPQRRYADALEVQRDLETIIAQLAGRRPVASAFVAMPFLPAMESVWRTIQAACLAHNVEPVRVDQALTRESIWDEICEELRRADFMLAVVSPQFERAPNPNVMLEIGYMRALAKPVVLITDDASALPFDLRTHRAIVYPTGPEGGGVLFEQLRDLVGGLLSRSRGR